jgi:hypothetical protein
VASIPRVGRLERKAFAEVFCGEPGLHFNSWIGPVTTGFRTRYLECPAIFVPVAMRETGILTRPAKLSQKALEISVRGSVSARLAGTVAVNVTQVMVSSKRPETRAWVRSLPAAVVRWECGKRAAFSKAALSPIQIGQNWPARPIVVMRNGACGYPLWPGARRVSRNVVIPTRKSAFS